MYRYKAHRSEVIIDGRTVAVDSLLEERIIRYLDENGFKDRWEKPEVGINVRSSNYTPDLKLSIQEGEMTHCALVEIKPAKYFFTDYISRRMRGIAPFYHTQVLLLYAERENRWYRIDIKTGSMQECPLPIPGRIPIGKMYKPFALNAPRVYSHHYQRRAGPVIASKTLDFVADVVSTVFKGPKGHRRTKRRH